MTRDARFWWKGDFVLWRGSAAIQLRQRCDLESSGHFHQICYGLGFHLLHYLAPVCFHCDLADAELTTDLLIQQTGHD